MSLECYTPLVAMFRPRETKYLIRIKFGERWSIVYSVYVKVPTKSIGDSKVKNTIIQVTSLNIANINLIPKYLFSSLVFIQYCVIGKESTYCE